MKYFVVSERYLKWLGDAADLSTVPNTFMPVEIPKLEAQELIDAHQGDCKKD